ncbi:MAG: redoxin domain-containing protein [Pseudomonadota bacterium]
MLKSTLAAIALSIGLSGMAAAETDATAAVIGPVVGEAAPSLAGTVEVTPSDAVVPADALGTVLVFVRSADWCPFCKTQLEDLKTAAAPLEAEGWALQALSYDSPDLLEAFAADKELNYVLLSDEDSSEIDAFALRNMDVLAGSRFDGIPHPAIVFIAGDGTVSAVLREEGYRDRPPVDLILETVSLLNAADAS